MIKSKKKIGLVQINNSFSGQSYLPYSIACLQSYSQKSPEINENFEFLPLIYKREAAHKITSSLLHADIVGFSAYVWNINLCLEIAKRLKTEKPEITILFGGPQVPNIPDTFLKDNPSIDFTVHGEGEKAFADILKAYPTKDYTDVSGISFLNDKNEFIQTLSTQRLNSLEELPSPFLNGIFDKLIADNPEENWIALWETNRGCPFKCSYCDWGSAVAAKVTKFNEERLFLEADWISNRKIGYVFVCDANFGMLARDLEIAEHIAANRGKTGFPEGFSVQNTKNATDRAYATQKILSDAGLNKGVALSMQSISQEALKNIQRDNISLQSYIELQERFTKDGIETFSDLILGLPGETYESFIEGINQLILNGQYNRIQFNNCAILPNAEMGDPAYLKKFDIKTVETEIINIHGKRAHLEDDVAETQELIISTYSMSEEDWKKSRVFAWMSAFLFFDKILQIPLMVLHELTKLDYKDMIDTFLNVSKSEYPQIAAIRDFFQSEADALQQGGAEYTYSEKWLDIYWPADEYAYIDLATNDNIDVFYKEAENLLLQIPRPSNAHKDALAILSQAILLNKELLHRPFTNEDVSCELDYNILEFYEMKKKGESPSLKEHANSVEIKRSERAYDDIQTWCREVVWWGNKKGAYLYPNNIIIKQIAGHY